MNNDEVYEIKKTWEIPMKDSNASGVALVYGFLSKYPSNLEKFADFKEIPITELKENVKFKAHATRIMRVFNDSIKSLGSDSCEPKLEEIWSTIAKTHFKRQIEKRSFNELKEVILEVLTAVCSFNEKQSAAWIKLLDYVYHIIFTTLDKLEAAAK